MTKEEIREIIGRDWAAFNDAINPEILPDWTLDNFQQMIWESRQKDFPIFARELKSILSKTGAMATITFQEAGFILNAKCQCEPKWVADDFYTFLERKEKMAQMLFRWNQALEKMKSKMSRKEDVLFKGLQSTPKIIT